MVVIHIIQIDESMSSDEKQLVCERNVL